MSKSAKLWILFNDIHPGTITHEELNQVLDCSDNLFPAGEKITFAGITLEVV